ncbi:MAG: cytidylate kinase family protein [Spirochaetia bacterium]|jgi:cytidylate kinase|uniref:BON domain-containing protein n=2 Tax=root TaxID=1 RepID=A0A644TJT7_9ZZZZ|nr:cytidylate kinase family protein [Spirochaetia bacterium]MDD3820667.1 cytidylate kinase family protein [Spirochaetales bacterium]NLX44350.1 BON domain-containing protein [Treponema sp.]VBB40376.1 putative phospholipid-binding domain family protein [uncultured Spirochaetota bacterium]HAP54386.1 phospholipid-binding protein [Spirochaetaceae bacterium]
MAIITIARELASLGEETALELTKISGYSLIDKDYLEEKLNSIGISAEKREKYDEKNPGFWASLSQQRDNYLHYLKTAILDAAQENNCVIMGRGAYAILRGVPHAVSVKITAPIAVRVERARKLYNCDNKRALQILEESDHDRGGFHKYFFSTNWVDAREYDLTINTGSTDPIHAAVAIDSLRKAYIDKEKEEAGVQKIADLVLAQNVVTEIIYARKIPVHFLEATVERGSVVLHGVANAQSSIDSALNAAHEVSGVKHVESAIQLVQEFTVMP